MACKAQNIHSLALFLCIEKDLLNPALDPELRTVILVSPQNWPWNLLIPSPALTPDTHKNLRWIRELNVNASTRNLLEEYIKKSFFVNLG